MTNPLLDCGSPSDFAERRQAFEIKAKIEDFARLVEIIEADLATLDGPIPTQEWRHAPADIRLRFSWADVQKSLPALQGRITAAIAAVCQRCLEPFELSLETGLDLLLVPAGVTRQGDTGREVWEIEHDTIRLIDVVEEALIMALPFSAMHDESQECNALPAATSTGGKVETVRPFANLKQQMDDGKR